MKKFNPDDKFNPEDIGVMPFDTKGKHQIYKKLTKNQKELLGLLTKGNLKREKLTDNQIQSIHILYKLGYIDIWRLGGLERFRLNKYLGDFIV